MSGLTQITPDVISTNTISGLISAGFTSMNVATMGTQTINSGSANTLTLRANNTTAITIDTSGNVGISNTTPLAILTVNSAANTTSLSGTTLHLARDTNTILTMDSFGGSPQLIARTANGSSTTPSALLADRALLTLGARGFANTAFTSQVKSFIGIYSGENWTDSAQGTYINFHNTPVGSTTRAEVMRITANGQIAVSSTGSAAAPVISKSDDLNTGIFFPAADTIAFSEGGVESMRIDSAGQVGVGVTPNTWSTGKVVEVGNSGTSLWGLASGTSYFTASYYFNSGDKFGVTGNYAQFIQQVPADGSFRFSSSTTTGTAGDAATMAERMRITAAGNVGIGTGGPQTRLHIAGNLTIENSSNAPFIDFVESGDNTDVKARIQMDQVSGTAGQLLFHTEGSGTLSERMRISSTGLVGIGTNNPQQLLDLYGSGGLTLVQINGAAGISGYFGGCNTNGSGVLTATARDLIIRAEGSNILFSYSNVETARFNANANFVLKGGSTGATGIGITFPAAQSASSDANCLDDYEEGTWTPVITNGTNNVGAYYYQGGSYVKIGKQVWITIQISVFTPAPLTSGNIKITGLPFTPAQLPNIGSQTGYLINGLKYFPTTGAMSLSLSQGSTEMIPYFSSSYGTQMTHTDLAAGGQWWAQGYYVTT